jgi:hypothetical protein
VSNQMPVRISRRMDPPPTTIKSYSEEIGPIFTSNPRSNKRTVAIRPLSLGK